MKKKHTKEEIAATLRLKEELSRRIKKANKELKKIAKKMGREKETLGDIIADTLGEASSNIGEQGDDQ